MEYVIVIEGLTAPLSVHHIEDIIGDLKMYLDDENVEHTDVLIKERTP